jgi:hypothetical protein
LSGLVICAPLCAGACRTWYEYSLSGALHGLFTAFAPPCGLCRTVIGASLGAFP